MFNTHLLAGIYIYPISFLSVRISNENALFSIWLKLVPLGWVVIHICLAAKWTKVTGIRYLSIANFVGGAILEGVGDVSVFGIGHVFDSFR